MNRIKELITELSFELSLPEELRRLLNYNNPYMVKWNLPRITYLYKDDIQQYPGLTVLIDKINALITAYEHSSEHELSNNLELTLQNYGVDSQKLYEELVEQCANVLNLSDYRGEWSNADEQYYKLFAREIDKDKLSENHDDLPVLVERHFRRNHGNIKSILRFFAKSAPNFPIGVREFMTLLSEHLDLNLVFVDEEYADGEQPLLLLRLFNYKYCCKLDNLTQYPLGSPREYYSLPLNELSAQLLQGISSLQRLQQMIKTFDDVGCALAYVGNGMFSIDNEAALTYYLQENLEGFLRMVTDPEIR